MGFHLGTDKTALEVLLKGVSGDSLEPGGLAERLVPTPLLTSAQILPASRGPGASPPWEAFLTMQACRVPPLSGALADPWHSALFPQQV